MMNKKRETILFAEDESQIRWITSELLKAEGYKVLTAENGELAYNLALQHRDEIDILLTDLNMPKIRGKELIEMLLVDNPDLKVLISSGYIRDKGQKIEIQGRKIPYLIKPYTRQDLIRVLAEL